jgi:hypothetical protein
MRKRAELGVADHYSVCPICVAASTIMILQSNYTARGQASYNY